MRSQRTAILAGTAVIALAVGVGAALAASSSTPPVSSFVAVGSGTTQYLADQFAKDYNATSPANPFYSSDAVNPATGLPGGTIKTKNDDKCSFTRPDGAGAGVYQLQKKLTNAGNTQYCVDLARMDRNIRPADGPGLVSVLFAKDLISYAINSGGNGVTNLTSAELTAIYSCDATLINSSYHGAVTWKEVGGTSKDAIVPVLPQSDSGVRQQWMSDIGVTTPGSCVRNGSYRGDTIDENEGDNAVYTSTGDPSGYRDVVGVFSGADYVCQVYTKKCPNDHGVLVLGKIDGRVPLTSSHTLNISSNVKTTFSYAYINGVYMTALNAGTSPAPKVPTSPVDLTEFLGRGGGSGWICGATASTDIKNFGFYAPIHDCGALTGQ